MDAQIVAAIIAGGVAIVSPFLTYAITRAKDHKILGRVKGQRKAVIGLWKGQIGQPFNSEVIASDIEITFKAASKLVEGDAQLMYARDHSLMHLKFNGGFFYERFIRFDYHNQDDVVLQFGGAILELSADGKTMTGKFCGYGSKTGAIVSGDVQLIRSV